MNSGEFFFLRGDSAGELLDLINEIQSPFEIISVYACGSHHYAWIRRQLKKKKI